MGGNRIEMGEAVAAISIETSFVDRGVKAIVFADGTGFAWKLVDAQNRTHAFVSFQLPDDDHKQLIAAFNEHGFLSLPKKIIIRATDGTSEWITIADKDDFHRVYHYLAEERDFSAVRDRFVEVVDAYLPQGSRKRMQMNAEDFMEAIFTRIEKLPKTSRERKAAAEWLDQQVRHLRAQQLIDQETGDEYIIPGDGAAVYRELRQVP